MAYDDPQWTPQGPLDIQGRPPTVDPTRPDYTGIYGAPASISPQLATDTPQGASVPSPGFAGMPGFVEGLGGSSQASMTGPTQEASRGGNWADALQAFGAGLSDAGMGLQGKQGNALASLMEFQQKQQQRQAELQEKLEQQKQERYRHDFQNTLQVVEKLKGDPKKLKTVLESMAAGGSISAQTMRRAGFGEDDYDEALAYIETIRMINPELAKQLDTNPSSISTSVLRANVDIARDIRKEEAKALVEQHRAAFIESKQSRGEPVTEAELAFMGHLKKVKAEGEKVAVEASVAQQFGKEQAAATLAQTQAQNILDPRVQEARTTLAQAGRTQVNVDQSGNKYGEPEKGLAWARNPDRTVKLDARGAPIAIPYQGGSVFREQEAGVEKAAAAKQQQMVYADVVVEDVDRVLDIVKNSPFPVTGLGSLGSFVPGTPQHNVSALLDTIKANAGFDRLQQMRQNSPTGGALGQVSEFENKLLQATLGSVLQSQSKEQFVRNVKRVKEVYLDTIHGKGNRPANLQDILDKAKKKVGAK